MQADPNFIVSLSDTSAGPSLVGGKGASLTRIATAGLSVPPGFYFTTTAYRRFVTEYELQEPILAAVSAVNPDLPATLEEASSRIGQLFAQYMMPDEIADAIRRAYADLGANAGIGVSDLPVAVRSSATAEDFPSASFAGQLRHAHLIRAEAERRLIYNRIPWKQWESISILGRCSQ